MNKKHLFSLSLMAALGFSISALAQDATQPPQVIAPPAASSHILTVEKLNSFNQLHDVKVSPDGQYLVYGLKKGQEKGSNHLWLKEISSGKTTQLTSNKASEHNVIWTTDSKGLYFVSGRSGSSQIWYLPLTGGEARQITDLALDVEAFKISKDGKTLALSMTVKPGCSDFQCSLDAFAAQKAKKHNTRAYDQLMVRHWDTWKTPFYSHLFIANLEQGKRVTSAKDVINDWATDFAGMGQVAFNPDNKSLVFSAKAPAKDNAWSTNYDLYQVDLTSLAMTNLTEDNKAWDAKPVFSPDGRFLAYTAMKTPGYESDKFTIYTKDLKTGTVNEVAPLWDRSVSSFTFGSDSRTLFVIAQDLGQKSIFEVSPQFGDVRTIYNTGYAGDLQVVNNKVYFTRHTLGAPKDIFVINKDGYGLEQLTQVNKDKLAGIKLGDYQQFTFKGWNNEDVHGYWIKPANFEQGKQYPMAFLVHGGPQGSFGNMFHYRWNAQLWAAQGYGVVMIDFHGSIGYGQAFTDSISRDWGGKPLEDLQKGFAYITEQQDWLSADNACALGASYGGYMMNWIAGNWNDGFNCLVNHAGLFDMRSFYNTTEELFFPEHDMGGPVFEGSEDYNKFNPAAFVNNWKTPMLVIQGELDYRVPYAQSLGAFTTLQRKGIDSRLVMFPDEDHHIRNADNLVEWYREIFVWLEKYTTK
jgi:dipeptidyl aminopeptidase/acylaminoacyl peptidase